MGMKRRRMYLMRLPRSRVFSPSLRPPPWRRLSTNGLQRRKKNIFGQTVNVVEMQSEGGASGTVHGALEAGALTTTYTASQGLLLMIPNMYKISGELLPRRFPCQRQDVVDPCAFHLRRPFGRDGVPPDRICASCLNESAGSNGSWSVAHLSAIRGRVPFLHFFDGFRTSHEIQKIETLDYEDLKPLIDRDALNHFRRTP